MSPGLDDSTQYRLELHAYAMTYVSRGWAVVPLSAMTYDAQGRKHVRPLIRWQRHPNELVTTPEQVERWFGLTGRGEGIAIATEPSGLLMVDEDAYKDGFAGASLPLGGWVEEHAGRGGRHLYYANPDGSRNTAGRLGTGVDTRGAGGLAYAAPTRATHADGRVTQWRPVSPIGALPAPAQLPPGPAVVQRAHDYRPAAAVGRKPPTVKPRDEAYSIVAAKRAAWLASTQGVRHGVLMDFAGTYARVLFADGLLDYEVYAALEAEVDAHPDAAEFETAEKDIADAVRYAKPDPWVFGTPAGFEGRFTAPDPGEAPAPADVGDGGELFALGDPGFYDNPALPPEAVYGAFNGQVALFYGDGVHWLQGESESGKTWAGLAVVVELLESQADPVIIVDYEDTRAEVVERLRALGMTREQYTRLVYVAGHDVSHAELRAHLDQTERSYALMLLDGVTSALTAAGANGNDGQEVTRWADQVPRRARMAICIDHVVKAVDDRRGMAIGSQAKKAVVTGTSWEVVCLRKFGRGKDGVIELRIQKDKRGGVRGRLDKAVRVDLSSSEDGRKVRLTAGSGASGGFFDDPHAGLFSALYADGVDGGVSGNELWRAAKDRQQGYSSAAPAKARMLELWREYYAERMNNSPS